jgi:hypothetical protein
VDAEQNRLVAISPEGRLKDRPTSSSNPIVTPLPWTV